MREASENASKSTEEEAEEKRERQRIEVLTEILLSERYFVRDVETIVFVSITPSSRNNFPLPPKFFPLQKKIYKIFLIFFSTNSLTPEIGLS
jgi:hypothetical protein